jgi:sulfur carrier protein ThiS
VDALGLIRNRRGPFTANRFASDDNTFNFGRFTSEHRPLSSFNLLAVLETTQEVFIAELESIVAIRARWAHGVSELRAGSKLVLSLLAGRALLVDSVTGVERVAWEDSPLTLISRSATSTDRVLTDHVRLEFATFTNEWGTVLTLVEDVLTVGALRAVSALSGSLVVNLAGV